MKAYLTGPRKGQTMRIRNIQFIDGVADVSSISPALYRDYGVRDNPPECVLLPAEPAVIPAELEEAVDIRKMIKEKVDEANQPTPITTLPSDPWFTTRRNIESMTGTIPKNKREALILLNRVNGTETQLMAWFDGLGGAVEKPCSSLNKSERFVSE